MSPAWEQGTAPIRLPRAANAGGERASHPAGCVCSTAVPARPHAASTRGHQTPKSHVVALAWCSQAPAGRQRRWSGLGALLGTGNSLSERLHGVRAAQSQDNAPRLLSTKLQPSSQLRLAGLFPPPPPHLPARHQSQPQPRSRGDGSSTSVVPDMQTGAVA